jgi:hypothetical protein
VNTPALRDSIPPPAWVSGHQGTGYRFPMWGGDGGRPKNDFAGSCSNRELKILFSAVSGWRPLCRRITLATEHLKSLE